MSELLNDVMKKEEEKEKQEQNRRAAEAEAAQARPSMFPSCMLFSYLDCTRLHKIHMQF